jgi:hypothetical protein
MPPEDDSTPAPAPAPASVEPAPAPESAEPAPAPAPASAEPAPKAEEPPAVPESYEFKVPEGFYDPKVTDRVTEIAKNLKLQPEDAQKLLDASILEVTQYEDAVKQGLEATKAEWEKVVESDKEIGGPALAESKELSKSALTKFASEGLIKDLEETGFADHPEMLRFLSRIGRSMKESDFITPGSNSDGGDNLSPADKLYDNPTSKSSQ